MYSPLWKIPQFVVLILEYQGEARNYYTVRECKKVGVRERDETEK